MNHASVPPGSLIATLIAAIIQAIDPRIRFRLLIVWPVSCLPEGILGLQAGSPTLECMMTGIDFMTCFEQSALMHSSLILPLVKEIIRRIAPDERGCWKIGLADSPTKRFGPCFERANIHHKPSPRPIDIEWIYGHI